MPSREKQFSLFELIGWLGAVAATSAGATWLVLSRVESNELEGYRKAKDWKVSDAISQLTKLTSSLNITIAERGELKALREKQEEAEAVTKRLTEVIRQRDRLARAVNSMVGHSASFSIDVGSSHYAIPNTLLVAVVRSSSFTNTCEIRVRGSRESMEVGGDLGGAASGVNFQLRLTKVTDTSCEFSFQKIDEN